MTSVAEGGVKESSPCLRRNLPWTLLTTTTMSTTNHQYGEGYSGDNKVPTIAAFQAEQDRRREPSEEQSEPPLSPPATSSTFSVSSDKNLPPTPPAADTNEPPPRDQKLSPQQQKEYVLFSESRVTHIQGNSREMMKRMQPPKGTKATDKAKSKGQYFVQCHHTFTTE